MADRTKFTYAYMFSMKPLPKAEYKLQRALIGHFGLDDATELFTVLLRLTVEVMAMHDGGGEKWVKGVIDTYRGNKTEERVYEVGGKVV